jgi:Lar family restriction alleviation protein
MNKTLKPCPFCGGKATFEDRDSEHSSAGCISCGVSTHAFYGSSENGTNADARRKAVEHWNRRSPGWISVDERLPENDSKVLVALIDLPNVWTIRFLNDEWYDLSGRHFKRRKNITHWMPIPEPPEVSEE